MDDRLQQLHEALDDIIAEIYRICRKHDINCYMYGGTLLGAVRDGNFIPWDDDVDLAMEYDDFCRFTEICKTELSEKYYFQTHITDPEFPRLAIRIRKNDTFFSEPVFDSKEMHHGIFVDILPLTRFPKNRILQRLAIIWLIMLHEICCFNNFKHKSKLGLAIFKLGKKVPRATMYKVRLASLEWIHRHSGKKILCSIASHYKPYVRRTFDAKWFSQGVDMEFDGMTLQAPLGWDNYLRQVYGKNYIKPLPLDQRTYHGDLDSLVLGTADTEPVRKLIQNGSDAPLVSVVIPVYEVEQFLPATLDCICGQTYKNLEIICINDGSKDKSIDILKEYAAKDSRIKVFEQKNQGLSVTRNNGAKQATGKYLYFMDSDDLLELDAIEKLTIYAEANNLQMVTFDVDAFTEEKGMEARTEHFCKNYKRFDAYPPVCKGPVMLRMMEKNGQMISTAWSSFISREYFMEQELWFHPGILMEDYPYTVRAWLSAERLGYMHETFFHRRVRKGSIMNTKTSFDRVYGYFAGVLDVLDDIEKKHIVLKEADERYLRRSLRKRLTFAAKHYSKLSFVQQEKRRKLTPHEVYLFDMLVVNPTTKFPNKNASISKTSVPTTAPALTLKSTKSKTATASWNKIAEALNYNVYSSTDGKKWTKATTTNKTSFTLTKLAANKKIFVKVTAVNAGGKESPASKVKNVIVMK